MIKELFKDENFTFNEWCKIYLYNDFINYQFPMISNSERKYIILKHGINNKVNIYRP